MKAANLIFSITLQLVVIFPVSCFCQQNDSLFKKITIGISYEPNISYRQLVYSKSNNEIKKMRDNGEIPGYGFASGLNVNYKLNKKISLVCAIVYASKGMQTKKQQLKWAIPNASYPNKSKTKFVFQTIDISLTVNYDIPLDKTPIYICAGFSVANLIARKTSLFIYYPDGDKMKTSAKQNFGFKRNDWFFIMGFGIHLPLSNRWILHIEPVYRQGITSIVKNEKANEYLYSIGVNAKLFYRFKKKNT